MQEDCRTLIKIMTGCEYVYFTSRCNRSIDIATQILKKTGRETVLFQEEAGWLTYEKFILKAQLNPIKLITNDGLIYEKELEHHDMDSALLLNSFAGYFALHDMDSVMSACAKNNIILVNDVSGSIGLPQSKVGDIIVGSFGKAKPVNVGSGGFIATNDEDYYNLIKEIEEQEAEIEWITLERKLRNLDSRRNFLLEQANKVKSDLKDMDIVHKDHKGLNVVIRFSDENEKERITQYCKENNYEYTMCPREIRILDSAVSIEIKRLE